jgi:type I restriction enzyme, R subunit
MRFYSFVAQVIKLADTSLEKLYSYGAWLSRLLPNREVPPEIEITDDMLRLQAFRMEQKEQGSASPSAGDHTSLKPISEFGAKPYTEDEQKELSEIVREFNDRHGTNFSEEDILRYERVKCEIMTDDLTEMLRNNPPDVVYAAFAQAFFQGAIRMSQKDNEMQNILLTDAAARDKATQYFFGRALHEVRSNPAL